MRVWKLEASQSEEWHPSRWGYAWAETIEEALDLCEITSALTFNRVHEKHPDMVWPGAAGELIIWS